MDNNLSPISLNDEDDVVKIAALNEGQEATTDNTVEPQNTQCVLEIAPPVTPKKVKGKQLLNQKKRQIIQMKKTFFWTWLETSWQSDIKMRIMKPWLNKINLESLKTKDMTLYHIGRTITKIMKTFIEWLKANKKPLANCGFANFEEWASDEGFSMI